jgi:hypothetical protein
MHQHQRQVLALLVDHLLLVLCQRQLLQQLEDRRLVLEGLDDEREEAGGVFGREGEGGEVGFEGGLVLL